MDTVNKDIERYKTNAVIICLIIAYTMMRFRLNGQYVEVTFAKLTAFSVIKPYAYRVLLPMLAHFLSPIASLHTIYLIFELVFVSLTTIVCKRLFLHYFNDKQATLFSLLFLLCLCLVYIINYRFAIGQKGTFFFPYDTPAVFFTLLGFYLCLKKNYVGLYLAIIVATLNRESSLLMVLLIPALSYGQKTSWQKPFSIALCCYVFVRALVAMALRNQAGNVAELYNLTSHYPHLTENVYFLLQKDFYTWLMAEMAFLPILWFMLSDFIPSSLQRVKYVALFYVLLMFVVGKIIEGRIFGEVVALLYLPCMIGVNNFLQGNYQQAPATTVRTWLSRQVVILTLSVCFIASVVFFVKTAN